MFGSPCNHYRRFCLWCALIRLLGGNGFGASLQSKPSSLRETQGERAMERRKGARLKALEDGLAAQLAEMKVELSEQDLVLAAASGRCVCVSQLFATRQ